ncbi:ATP-binding protein [Fusobacterium sp. MFO224]|uniref:ATP-binding protein n=1 Tax=Fusobacterium sp. MFO224 TaxID=3378070 RepID=UPI003852C654
MCTTNNLKRDTKNIFLLLLFMISIFLNVNLRIFATNYYEDYQEIIYNNNHGLPVSAANAITQTPDGFIWVGVYGGLLRYDSKKFIKIGHRKGINNVKDLFVDSNGKLWVCTSDNGIICYDKGDVKIINSCMGLKSNSVRTAIEDNDGDIIVGTTSGVSCINPKTMEVRSILGNDEDSKYIENMDIFSDGKIICVSNDGNVFILENHKLYKLNKKSAKSNLKIISVYVDKKTDEIYFGTDGNFILEGQFDGESLKLKKIDCGKLSYINDIKKDKEGNLLIASDTGIGYLNKKLEIIVFSDLEMNSSIDKIFIDAEENLWFVSSRQGVMKYTKSIFLDMGKKLGFKNNIINAILPYRNDLYIASDSGLFIINEKNKLLENDLTNFLKGERIRCLLEDKKGNLLIGTYTGDKGIVKYNAEGISIINENDGLTSSKIRSMINLQNGNIAVATNDGVNILDGIEITNSFGIKEGMNNSKILNLCETPDGTLFLGTDGGGISLFKDGKFMGNIDHDLGLDSDIILRLKYDERYKGVWILTGSSISFYDCSNLKRIKNFPFKNNYDIFFYNGKICILSNEGIIFTTIREMLLDNDIKYRFLNYKEERAPMVTANSFSYMDENENLYICGVRGVFKLDVEKFNKKYKLPRIALESVIIDGKREYLKNDRIEISGDVKRLQIEAYTLTYQLLNPTISYYLEGFDDKPIEVSNSDAEKILYNNLKGGKYTFHYRVIDRKNNKILGYKKIYIDKEIRFLETKYFPICLAFAGIMLFGSVLYFLFKSKAKMEIQKHKELQHREVEEALEKAKIANNSKNEFLSQMSHDMRTPLGAVINFAEFGMEENEEGTNKKYFTQIKESSVYLLGLMNDILDAQRIENGKVDLVESTIDTKEFIQNVMNIILPKAQKKNIYFIEPILKKEKDIYKKYDVQHYKQILVNVIGNAIKYTPNSGMIKWELYFLRDEEGKLITRSIVTDNGVGISKKYQKHIFEKFTREKNRLSKKEGGTGLGLAITKELVDLLHGTIEVESELEKGSRFIIELPVKEISEEEFKKLMEEEVVNSTHELKNKRILLCEDNDINAKIVEKILSSIGIKVVRVKNGFLGVMAVKKGKYDAVLMDIKMPVMTGLEATKKIRKFNKDIPIIALSANVHAEDIKKSLNVGMNAHLSKPIDKNRLFKTLLEVMNNMENI